MCGTDPVNSLPICLFFLTTEFNCPHGFPTEGHENATCAYFLRMRCLRVALQPFSGPRKLWRTQIRFPFELEADSKDHPFPSFPAKIDILSTLSSLSIFIHLYPLSCLTFTESAISFFAVWMSRVRRRRSLGPDLDRLAQLSPWLSWLPARNIKT